MNRRGSIAGGVALVFTVLVVVAGVWAVLNRQLIIDKLSYYQYSPSSAIASIAERAHFSEEGEFYFYVAHPKIQEASEFNNNCKRQEQASAILGCFNGAEIYLYDVVDERLDGVEEVTAAHEMLHVAFERLNAKEKQNLELLLEVEYDKINSDKLTQRMGYYARTEPGQRINELHSIIPTEFSDISPKLEAYYERYFTDRKAVVALHEGYSGRFDELANRSEELKQEIAKIEREVESMQQSYKTEIATLNQQIEAFNTRARNGKFNSVDEFDNARQEIKSAIARLESKRQVINRRVVEYNSKIDEYNNTVSESNSLQKGLDSSLAPTPSL